MMNGLIMEVLIKGGYLPQTTKIGDLKSNGSGTTRETFVYGEYAFKIPYNISGIVQSKTELDVSRQIETDLVTKVYDALPLPIQLPDGTVVEFAESLLVCERVEPFYSDFSREADEKEEAPVCDFLNSRDVEYGDYPFEDFGELVAMEFNDCGLEADDREMSIPFNVGKREDGSIVSLDFGAADSASFSSRSEVLERFKTIEEVEAEFKYLLESSGTSVEIEFQVV